MYSSLRTQRLSRWTLVLHVLTCRQPEARKEQETNKRARTGGVYNLQPYALRAATLHLSISFLIFSNIRPYPRTLDEFRLFVHDD
jgi:hypothetical protein